MRTATLSLALLLLAVTPAGASIPISLGDVVTKVSTENLNVYSNALRVYQAKESVNVARMNLLPRLNVWKIADSAIDLYLGLATFNFGSAAGAAAGMIEDIAPFLVPANWFRVKESKLLFLADKEGYRALWANEVMTAKSIYLHLLLDQALHASLEKEKQELSSILTIIRSRELLGGVPEGASRDIEIRLLALEEDGRILWSLIAEEQSTLGLMLGVESGQELILAPVDFGIIENLQPLSYEDFEFRLLDSAPELRQFDYFLAAAKYVRKEVLYSFLGSSNVSRGISGGVFDNLPSQDGLGFGTPASMRIVSTQEEILRVQRKGIVEVLKRQLRLLLANYNLDLKSYSNLRRRKELAEQAQSRLYARLTLGEQVETSALIEASRNSMQAEVALLAIKLRVLSNEDRLWRLLFQEDYSRAPALIEKIKEQKPV